MGSSKDAISKRRPRQNIIFQILKNAKRQGSAGSTASATNTSTASSSRSHAHGSGAEYHGSKRGLLASAVELTRRSKRVTSRGGRDGGGRARTMHTRRKRNQPFVKGQKAFYRSAKGIAKVTVVGIHHDAKLEPYYTIQLRDGKEKQTDGKHLTPIQEEVKEEKKKEKEIEASSGRSRSAPEILTDPMSDSDGGVKEVVIDYTDKDGDEGMREPGHAPSRDALVPYYSSSSEEDDDDQNAKKFALGQDAYYRSPGGGGVLKIRVRARGDRPNRYHISLPNGSIAENVRASKLATLMDLTSKELSTLMKERNKRQRGGGGGGGGHGHGQSSGDKSRASSRGRRSRSRPRHPSTGKSSSAAHEKIPAAVVDDVGYDAGEGEPTSSGSEPSLSSSGVGSGTGASSSDPTSVGEKKEKPPLLALPEPIRMVEAFTESGEKKTVPLYSAGMHVRYQNAAGIMPAEILSYHLDDLLDPYYTIRLADGREKQTDNAHILVNELTDEEAKKQDEADEEEEDEEDEDEDDKMAKEEEERKAEEEGAKEKSGEGGEQGQEQEQIHAQGKENHPQEEEETMPHRPGRRSSIAIAHQTPKHPVAEKWLSASMTCGDSSEPFNEGILESPAVKKHQDSDFSAAANTPVRPHPAAGRAAASPTPALTPPAKFAPGDDVLYSSSAGDCMKAVVVRVQRDKKSRHFFVIKLREGKEKQVYGHRLKLLADVEGEGGRRARSRSRGLRAPSSNSRAPSHASTARSRGRSQASKGLSYQRSESIDSRASDVLSNSSRRSEASRDRAHRTGSAGSAASRGRSTGRYGDESLASTRGGSTVRSRRDESLGASVRSRASHGEESTKRASRDRSQSTVRRIKSIANSSGGGERKHRREGRERSRSRAPSEDSRASSSHHHSSSSNVARSRASRPAALSASMVSKSSKEEDYSTATGADERSTTKSISRLRNFRKNFAMRKH